MAVEPRAALRVRSQSGLTLIEVVISILLLSIVLVTASSSIIVMIRSADTANHEARANVLATGFGEALKRLDYVECASPSLYQDDFEAQQGSLDPGDQLLRPGDSVEITDISSCAAGDPGVQQIEFDVETRGSTRTAQVVKRNNEYVDGLNPRLEACRVTAPAASASNPACIHTRQEPGTAPDDEGDVLAVFDLSAAGSSPEARIVEYRFDCNDGETVITTADPDDPAAVCEYTAATEPQERDITLRLTDIVGRTTSVNLTVWVPAAAQARPPPIVDFTANCPSDPELCGVADPALTVTFDASNSAAVEGRIVAYRWNFGDPNSGSANTAEGVTASHTYTRNGPFTVRLTVVDDIGITESETLVLNIERPGPEPPTAEFTFSPQPAVAPQTIDFDATASADASGNSVSSYAWDFGDGGSSAAATPAHTYTSPGTYTVNLVVADANGTTSSATGTVVVGTFPTAPPTEVLNFRMTDAKAGGLGIFGLFGSGHFYFAWTNPPASGGDIVKYEIEIKYRSGQCFGFNTTTRIVNGGAPGTTQTYDFVVPPASDVCLLTTYDWRVRLGRENPQQGTAWGPWSEYQQWTVRRT